MKKKIVCFAAVLAVMLLGAACSLFEAEYAYSEPYGGGAQSDIYGAGTEIKNYAQLCDALQSAVNEGRGFCILRFNSYAGSVSDDMAAACYELRTSFPMGVYAVESVDYELNRIVSYYAADVSIRYKRTQEEIGSVITLNGLTELKNCLLGSLEVFDELVTLKVYSSVVNTDYIAKMIEDAYYEDPMLLPLFPEVRVRSYPEEGFSRIYEIMLDYGLDTPQLETLRESLQSAVITACAGIAGEDAGERALQCAEYLRANCTDHEEREYGDTAYGALVGHSGDSRAMAQAYKAMCDVLDIECMVVRGSLGTLGTQVHYWNIIGIEDAYYHVDTSRIAELGLSETFLKADEELWGAYLWEAEEYPSCGGSLSWRSYVDHAPADEGEKPPLPTVSEATETPAVSDEPDTSEPVETTKEPTEPTESPEPVEPLEPVGTNTPFALKFRQMEN